MSKNTLLINDTMLKERTAVHGNIDPKLIYPDVKVAQDMYIQPILGSGLFNRLITGINNNDLTADETALINDYIIDALIHYVLMDLPTSISNQFWNKGVSRKQGDNTDNPSMSELLDISNKYRMRAEWYGERLKKYLIENASSILFSEYINPGSGHDTIYPGKTTFTMPVYLGEECNYKSFEERSNRKNC